MHRMCGLSRLKVLMLFGIPLRTSFDDVENSCSSPVSVASGTEETGMGRVRSMFTRNEYGEFGAEINSCIQGALTGLLVGAAYGGFIWSRKAYLEFIENNQATSFANHFEAKKALQNHVTVYFAKGALKWGVRVSMFSGLLMLVCTTVSVYRGKTGILEYVVAGGITGSLYRTHLGLPGMIVGGLLGTTLGTCAGYLVYGLLKLTNLSMEDLRVAQYKLKEARKAAVVQNFKSVEEEVPPLFSHHDDKVHAAPSSNLNSVKEKLD